MHQGLKRALPRRQGLWRLVLLAIILVTVVGYYAPARNYLERSGQISREREMTEELRRQHEALVREKELLATGEYVEQVARRDLGMIKPGEQPYVVRELEQGQQPAPPPARTEDSFIDRAAGFLGSLLP